MSSSLNDKPCFGCLAPAVIECARCEGSVTYCDKSCQLAHWNRIHRAECAQLVGAPVDKLLVPKTSYRAEAPETTEGLFHTMVLSDKPQEPLVLLAVVDPHGIRGGATALSSARTVVERATYRADALARSLMDVMESLNTVLGRLSEVSITMAAVLMNTATRRVAVANIGDCGVWMVRNGRLRFVSTLHVWSQQSELNRVSPMSLDKRGAASPCWLDTKKAPFEMVYEAESDGRQVRLDVSRALGAPKMRECGVTSEPEITEFDAQRGDKFVLGSSGAMRLLSNGSMQSLLDEVGDELPKGRDEFFQLIWRELEETALHRQSRSRAATPPPLWPTGVSLMTATL